MKKFIILLLACLLMFCGCGANAVELYTVTFDTGGGSFIEPQVIEKGEKAIEPPAPTKECCCEFDGWYIGDEEWSFIGYVVTEDITLTAKWVKCFGLNEKELEILKDMVNSWENIADIQRSYWTYKDYYGNETVDKSCYQYKIVFESGAVREALIQCEAVNGEDS